MRGQTIPTVAKTNFEKLSEASSPTKTVFGVKRVSMANQLLRQSTTLSNTESVNERPQSINHTQTGETGGTETAEQWVVSQGTAEKVSTHRMKRNYRQSSNGQVFAETDTLSKLDVELETFRNKKGSVPNILDA